MRGLQTDVGLKIGVLRSNNRPTFTSILPRRTGKRADYDIKIRSAPGRLLGGAIQVDTLMVCATIRKASGWISTETRKNCLPQKMRRARKPVAMGAISTSMRNGGCTTEDG